MKTAVAGKAVSLFLIFIVFLLGGCAAKQKDNDGIAEWEEIMEGNIELISDDEVRKMLQCGKNSQNLERLEWVCHDVNHDGRKELILQEKEYGKNEGMKCIVGIFALTDNGVKTIIWDVVDMVEYFSFCNDQLVYYCYSGGLVGIERFEIYEYDEDWNEKRVGGLEKIWIDDIDEVAEQWRMENPEMARNGVYYRGFSVEEADKELRRIYTTMTEEEWNGELYRLFRLMT